jgi:hypothetical protein
MSDLKVRRAAIQKLEDRFGRVSAEKLVDAASDRRHPLHNDFTWDNTKAGHQYRLHEARAIIVSIRFAINDVSKAISTAYVRDPNAARNTQGYIAVSRLRSERDAAREALMNEETRLQSQLERMRELAAALDLVDELDAIIESVMVFSSRLRGVPAVGAAISQESQASTSP